MASGFQLKQFFVEHQQCAMKVGTDSLMLGSWAEVGDAKNVLDIGTGSGLLSLMLAQRSLPSCQIIGLDIDSAAIAQAQHNASRSPWSERIRFEQIGVEHYRPARTFDLIICNPPYFAENKTANIGSTNQQRQQARQTTHLSFATLVSSVTRLLAADGVFYLVLPADRVNDILEIATESQLYCNQVLLVKARDDKPVMRHLMRFSRQRSECTQQRLTIHSRAGEYTEQYRTLCQEYYLNF